MNRLKRFFDVLILAPGFALSFMIYGGLLSGSFWPCELMCHFRIQYLIALVPCVFGAIFLRQTKSAAIFLSALILNVVLVAPLFINNVTPSVAVKRSRELKVLQLNLYVASRQFEAVRECIEKSEADIICLQEVSPPWQKYLKDHLKSYHQFIFPREDCFGVAILSKQEMTNVTCQSSANDPFPTEIGDLKIDNEEITVICTHPFPPTSNDYYKFRNRQIAEITSYACRRNNTVILCGDLNATRWSQSLIQLLQTADLIDTSNGFGWQPTWPTADCLLLIPIDQIFVSKNVMTLDRKILNKVGSDHYPVLARLAITEKNHY